MPRYEYKVVPAPTKGLKGKGVKGAEAKFAHAIQELMNGLSGYGWEYQRAETLPSVERAGLTGSTTEWRNVLVFRRLREGEADAFSPEMLPAPAAVAMAAAPAPEPEPQAPEEVEAALGELEEAQPPEEETTPQEKTTPQEETPPADTATDTDEAEEKPAAV